jgi:hypothetical protein
MGTSANKYDFHDASFQSDRSKNSLRYEGKVPVVMFRL